LFSLTLASPRTFLHVQKLTQAVPLRRHTILVERKNIPPRESSVRGAITFERRHVTLIGGTHR